MKCTKCGIEISEGELCEACQKAENAPKDGLINKKQMSMWENYRTAVCEFCLSQVFVITAFLTLSYELWIYIYSFEVSLFYIFPLRLILFFLFFSHMYASGKEGEIWKGTNRSVLKILITYNLVCCIFTISQAIRVLFTMHPSPDIPNIYGFVIVGMVSSLISLGCMLLQSSYAIIFRRNLKNKESREFPMIKLFVLLSCLEVILSFFPYLISSGIQRELPIFVNYYEEYVVNVAKRDLLSEVWWDMDNLLATDKIIRLLLSQTINLILVNMVYRFNKTVVDKMLTKAIE